VSYEDWQMQCCGDPFKIGDSIDWLVYKWSGNSLDTEDSLIGIDFIYDAHGTRVDNEMFSLHGVVIEIQAEYYKTELRLHPRIHSGQKPVPTFVYEKSCSVTLADGKDKDIDGLEFGSYRVTLQDCVLLPVNREGR
jgi:hypothetical protein